MPLDVLVAAETNAGNKNGSEYNNQPTSTINDSGAPRQELWLVTTDDDVSPGNSNRISTPKASNRVAMTGGFVNVNTTTSKKITSLEELKEAISWLETESGLTSASRSGSGLKEQQLRETFSHTRPKFSTNLSAQSGATNEVFLDEVKRFELFHSVIQHEDDLLNQRVSWIILAQSFLMAPFITESENRGSGEGSNSNALKYIAAIVGLATVIVTMPAILAAGRNIELQQHVYFAHISSEDRCRELHGHGRNPSETEMRLEHRNRMRYGHIFPNMAFRGRGAIPIVATVTALAILQVLGWSFFIIALVLDW